MGIFSKSMVMFRRDFEIFGFFVVVGHFLSGFFSGFFRIFNRGLSVVVVCGVMFRVEVGVSVGVLSDVS